MIVERIGWNNMKNSLSCEWMSLKLRSPIVVASLTPLSNARIKEHISFFSRAVSMGAGAIVLPSINPSRHGSPDINEELVETHILKTGICKNDSMAFSVLGPTCPNIVSVEYGLNLSRESKRIIRGVPIIASVACIGENAEIIEVIRELNNIGIDGIEINASCPNVETHNGDFRCKIEQLVNGIRLITDMPISLKLSPQHSYSDIIKDVGDKIESLSISNAYIGLVPPKLDGNTFSPYSKADKWAPGGIYGPFEKALTFYQIYCFREYARTYKLDIACIGGIVTGDDAIQAILLGASIVEISSGIAWKSMTVIQEMNKRISLYLEQNQKLYISEIRGKALADLVESADDIDSFMDNKKANIDHQKCLRCQNCNCLNRLCFAIHIDKSNTIQIDNELCSGCGWCVNMCVNNAIALKSL